jgi:hypothetical protein
LRNADCEMRIAELEIGELRLRIAKCGIAARPIRISSWSQTSFSRSAIPHSAIRSPHFHDTPALVGRSRANARSLRAPDAEADSCEQESQDKRDSNQDEGFLQTD